MTDTVIERIEHIVITPDICFGKPRIAGTRMRVKDVAYYYINAQWTVGYIAEQFDLTPGQIYAALSYYYDHKAEIDEEMRRDVEIDPEIARQTAETRQRIEARMAEIAVKRAEAAKGD